MFQYSPILWRSSSWDLKYTFSQCSFVGGHILKVLPCLYHEKKVSVIFKRKSSVASVITVFLKAKNKPKKNLKTKNKK